MRKHTWADEPPRPPRARPQVPDDRNISYSAGQAFRREASIAIPDFSVTQAEQRVLGDRAREAAEAQRADKDRRLLAAVQLGAALRVLGD
jgi:hypothetical protein